MTILYSARLKTTEHYFLQSIYQTYSTQISKDLAATLVEAHRVFYD